MIHLECDNDESLLLALGKTRAQLCHHAGKGRVSKALCDSANARDVGLVDEDPGQPLLRYLREFEVVEQCAGLGLTLFRHPASGKRFVEIQPDLEPWLYRLGEAIGIKPTRHRLPQTPAGLHQNAKKHRQHLVEYLQACSAAQSPHLAKLAEWFGNA